MYNPIPNKIKFPEIEQDILLFWKEHKIFEKSLSARKDAKEFVFYDGPPFATGMPHYGHLLAGTIKDIIPRYQTMKGFYVKRRFGWDCHGLPVEYEVEQDLKISGKTDIEKLGVAVFNEKCRSIVLRYTEEWRKTVTRMGRWVDFDNDYKTMDPSYMESLWWVFKSLWDKKLIYEGQNILPYCPRCSTPLSNFETNQGYSNVTDPAITVRFKIKGEKNAYILAWTTTPWTLPSNMALAVGEKITYARVQEKDAVYYLAKDRMHEYYKDNNDYLSFTEIKGSDLAGIKYEPLFEYFKDKETSGAFRVVTADFVSTEDGTGIVHIAPGFGEDDHHLGKAKNIPSVCPIDAEGRFTKEVTDYYGQQVKKSDSNIIRRLKDEEKLVRHSSILHSYPHCWRCETPLIYRGISSWFVNVKELKPRIIEANQKIHWVPNHIKKGRFGKWLEGARDWAISRNRYWGTPIPIWQSKDGSETVCIGSIKELEALSGRKIDDIHKHYIDDIEIPSKNGNGMLYRIPEVLDCWFESGAMPYAQAHYPFENKEHFEKHFPADFIAEGLDQTRGWFYTLMILATALFDKPAFKNVIVNGLILSENGKKMSKRLKNYPDPENVINSYGADALRLYMINSSITRAEDLKFSEDGVKHILRHLIIPLWNSYSFFVTYANIDKWSTVKTADSPGSNLLDRWIYSSMDSLINDVTTAMDTYDLQRAVRPFATFIDNLTNWYIRRSRRRFWKSQDDDDKTQAYRTLHYILIQLSKIAAPFIPFLSEYIYKNIRTKDMPESVHLCCFPTTNKSNRNLNLETEMALVMTTIKLGRLLRSENNLKVRQPLSVMHIISRNKETIEKIKLHTDIIMEELNVKKLAFGDNETDLAILKAKPDFKRLGPRFGAKVKKIAKDITNMDDNLIERLAGGEKINFNVNEKSIELTPEDVVIDRIPKEGMVVVAENQIVVALETELSNELIQEGLAREFINKVQNMRKTATLNVAQRINIIFLSGTDLKNAIDNYSSYIKSETLCINCSFTNNINTISKPDNIMEWNINNHPCTIIISPAST